MKSVFAPVAAAVLLAASAAAQLTVNTPSSPVECEPLLITWTSGTPPYFLSILPGDQPGAAALLSFPSTSATSLTWTVNFTANTLLDLNLRDSTGTVAQSSPFTVQSGPVTSCLTASGGSSPSSGSTSSGSTTSGATTPTTTPANTPATTSTTPVTTPVTTPTTPAASKSSSAGSSTTSAPPASAAVSAHTLNLGLATAMAAALFALVMA